MFSVAAERWRKLVRIKINGMLTLADVQELYRQEHAAVRGMGCKLGEHIALVDLTECALQLQDVASAFQREIDSSGKARRLALVTGGSVVKMQVRRILTRAGAELFVDIASAEAWLFSATDGTCGASKSPSPAKSAAI